MCAVSTQALVRLASGPGPSSLYPPPPNTRPDRSIPTPRRPRGGVTLAPGLPLAPPTATPPARPRRIFTRRWTLMWCTFVWRICTWVFPDGEFPASNSRRPPVCVRVPRRPRPRPLLRPFPSSLRPLPCLRSRICVSRGEKKITRFHVAPKRFFLILSRSFHSFIA